MQQSYRDFELLIVGDNCTDETEFVIRPLLSNKIRWINRTENSRSQSAPNNTGIQATTGKHIAYLGHDDIWSGDHLAALNFLFTADANLHFAVSGAIYHMPPGVERPQVTGIFNDQSAKFIHFFPPSSFAHRRDVIAKIDGWRDPEEIKPPVDAEFLLRAAQAGFKFASTGKITVHKFAAGHRYLSYLRPMSDEQERMLRSMEEPGFEESVKGIVDLARRTGGYMVVRHIDYDQYEPGQLARENAARKGNLRPQLRPVACTEAVPQETASRAWDWNARTPDGLRWVGLNPRPKLLIPFTSKTPVMVQMTVAHCERNALKALKLSSGGASLDASIGKSTRKGQHWEAIASFELHLSTEDYTVLELHLEGLQVARSGRAGIAVGEIVVGPLTSSLRRLWNTTKSELATEQAEHQATKLELATEQAEHQATKLVLAAEQAEHQATKAAMAKQKAQVDAILSSTSWSITAPIRAVASYLRRSRKPQPPFRH